MLSVALCSYNGSKYIAKQLWSILHQTRMVNEIVICDDRSGDNTIEIIEHIKQQTPIDIRIHQNESNLGVRANFQKAVNLCKGDIIFLSDQDDIWLSHKVETIVEWFETHPDKSVAFTNADLIDENGRAIKEDGDAIKLWDYFFPKSDRIMFEKGLDVECMMVPRATGASMAIRKSFLESKPFLYQTNENVHHDLAICINALECHQLGYIDDTLFKYRIHKEQQVGVGGYVRNHCNNDWRRPLYPEDYIKNLLRKKENIERADFLSWRIWTKHRIYGPIAVLLAINKYHNYYGRNCFTIMAYDMISSLKHSMLRMSRTISEPA